MSRPRYPLLVRLVAALLLAGCASDRCRGERCAGDAATATDAGPDAEPGADAGDGGQDSGVDAGEDDCPRGFQLCNRALAAGLLVEGPAYGRGAAFVDVDGDGWEDIWQSDSGTGYAHHARSSTLFRNLGDGTFEPFDLGIPEFDLLANWTGSWADVDNDGDPDLFLTNGGYSRESSLALYRNDLPEGGLMTSVAEDAGIREDAQQWWGASFADYDGDSWLDLAVTSIDGPLVLYHNEGDFTFVDVAPDVGLTDPAGDTKNPVWFDYDVDGDPDLYVASVEDHRLWRNDGATFEDVTLAVLDSTGTGVPVFSAAATDFDQDGVEDLYLGRWDREDFVLHNLGGSFEPFGEEIGLDMENFPETSENTMGLAVGDLDADGWPEVFIGPGRPEQRANAIIYCHEGETLRFRRCQTEVVVGHGEVRNHAPILGDPDHDGDVDVFWNLGGHVEYDLSNGTDSRDLAAYYVNRGNGRQTATVHLVGTASNRSAIGAHLVVDALATRHYWVRGTQGFQSQSSDWIVVALGQDSGTVTDEWPSGAASEVEVRAGDRVEIVE